MFLLFIQLWSSKTRKYLIFTACFRYLLRRWQITKAEAKFRSRMMRARRWLCLLWCVFLLGVLFYKPVELFILVCLFLIRAPPLHGEYCVKLSAYMCSDIRPMTALHMPALPVLGIVLHILRRCVSKLRRSVVSTGQLSSQVDNLVDVWRMYVLCIYDIRRSLKVFDSWMGPRMNRWNCQVGLVLFLSINDTVLGTSYISAKCDYQ